jgi:hypothetical protein
MTLPSRLVLLKYVFFVWTWVILGYVVWGIWGWIAFTGPYRLVARWEMDQFGSYWAIGTFLVPLSMLMVPFYLIGIHLQRQGAIPSAAQTATQIAASRKTRPSPAQTARRAFRGLVGFGGLALITATGAGLLGWHDSQRTRVVSRLDLSAPRAEAHLNPDLIVLTGVARTELQVEWTDNETRGGDTIIQRFLPLVAANWRTGQPVHFVLRMTGDNSARRETREPGRPGPAMITTRPAVLLGNVLPGAVRDEWITHSVALADDLQVLDENLGLTDNTYWAVTIGAALAVLVSFFSAAALRFTTVRARPAPCSKVGPDPGITELSAAKEESSGHLTGQAPAGPQSLPKPSQSRCTVPMPDPPIAEFLAGRGNSCLRAEASPDGRYAVMIASDEVGQHWVDTAALCTMPDERLVAPIGIHYWSTDRIVWAADGSGVILEIRRYPGDVPGVTLEIDLNRRSARIAGGTEEVPLTRMSAALEADYYRRGGKG